MKINEEKRNRVEERGNKNRNGNKIISKSNINNEKNKEKRQHKDTSYMTMDVCTYLEDTVACYGVYGMILRLV
jgi:hypothetical protein